MNPASNDQLQAIIAELDLNNLPYKIENGSKHIMVRYEVNGTPCVASASRGHNSNRRSTIMKRADIRRAVRTYGQKPTETLVGEQEMSTLPRLTNNSIEIVRGEPRMRDSDIAAALGFSRLQNIRKLIIQHQKELRNFGPLCFGERSTTDRGGRPVAAYLLNKDQAILIAMVSRAPGSSTVRQQVLKVYNEWNLQSLGKKDATMIETTKKAELPAVVAEPELLLNREAITAITEAVKSSATSGITKDDLREVMTGILEFQSKQFEALAHRLIQPAQAMPAIEDASMKLLTMRLTESVAGFQSSIESLDQRITALAGDKREKANVDKPTEADILKEEKPVKPKNNEPKVDEEVIIEPEDTTDINGIYKMIGLKPSRIGNRMALSQKIRISMHTYSLKKNIDLYVSKDKYGTSRIAYPNFLVREWYKASGKDLVSNFLIKESGILA